MSAEQLANSDKWWFTTCHEPLVCEFCNTSSIFTSGAYTGVHQLETGMSPIGCSSILIKRRFGCTALLTRTVAKGANEARKRRRNPGQKLQSEWGRREEDPQHLQEVSGLLFLVAGFEGDSRANRHMFGRFVRVNGMVDGRAMHSANQTNGIKAQFIVVSGHFLWAQICEQTSRPLYIPCW